MMKLLSGFFLVSVLLMNSCATIVGDKTHLMPIKSTPSAAEITIIDEKGSEVFKGATPTTVTLDKSDGSYWGKKSYTVSINKEGFEPNEIAITASANGWYIAGNIVFGGLIGWFIVDPFNGAMYNLSPEEINASLGQKSSFIQQEDGTIFIVLLEDVPLDLRDKMKRIN